MEQTRLTGLAAQKNNCNIQFRFIPERKFYTIEIKIKRIHLGLEY